MTLPHALKRIRLHLARSKEFPAGSADHGYEFVAPLDSNGHIDPQLWQKDRNTAGYAGSGMVAMSKSGILSTNPAVQSTPDGYSITIRPGLTMMNRDIALVCMRSCLENTFQYTVMMARCTHSR